MRSLCTQQVHRVEYNDDEDDSGGDDGADDLMWWKSKGLKNIKNLSTHYYRTIFWVYRV